MNNKKKLKKIKELLEMKENGIIDEVIFESRKSKIINSTPFKPKNKSLIIFAIIFALILSSSIFGTITYINYINQENLKKVEAERVALLLKQEQQNFENKKNEIKQIRNEIVALEHKLLDEQTNFCDSAFGTIYYINFPNYYDDWIKQLNSMKNNTDQIVQYYSELSFKSFLLKENLNFKDDPAYGHMCEYVYNDLVNIIKTFNERIEKYNNVAVNFSKPIYLDEFNSDYDKEVDLNEDGEISSPYKSFK